MNKLSLKKIITTVLKFKNRLLVGLKPIVRTEKKFFLVIIFCLMSAFALLPFVLKRAKQLDMFLTESNACEVSFVVSPSCESITFNGKALDSSETTPTEFNPSEKVVVGLATTYSNYAIIGIGTNTNYTSIIKHEQNIGNGSEFSLPSEPGNYFITTNAYDDSKCKMMCTGISYEAANEGQCLVSGNFLSTGRKCVNNCKGWIKIKGISTATPIPTVPVVNNIPKLSCNYISLLSNGINVKDGKIKLGQSVEFNVNNTSIVKYYYRFYDGVNWSSWLEIGSKTFTPSKIGRYQLAANIFDKQVECNWLCSYYLGSSMYPTNGKCDASNLGTRREDSANFCTNNCDVKFEVESVPTPTACPVGTGVDCDNDGSLCTVNKILNFKDAGAVASSGWCTCCQNNESGLNSSQIDLCHSNCIYDDTISTPSNSVPVYGASCSTSDPDNDNCLKCINSKWSWYFSDPRASTGWCNCCKKSGICTTSTFTGKTGDPYYGITDSVVFSQQCN